jgi:hypothetical protein
MCVRSRVFATLLVPTESATMSWSVSILNAKHIMCCSLDNTALHADTNWFEFGWYSCPTCPPGGWDCSSFSLEDVAAATTGRTVDDVNRTLGCYSQYLTRKLNISENQLVNPATQTPLVPALVLCFAFEN